MTTLLAPAGLCLDASGQGGVPPLQQLDFLPTSCNSDGSVLFGYDLGALDGTSNRIFRWTPAGGRVELPLPPGAGYAYLFREDSGPSHTVSANGNVIAASVFPSPDACCPTSVARWQGTAMTATSLFDWAQGITSDGAKVYGNTDDPEQSAVVWTNGQVSALGVPQGAPPGWTWVSDSSDAGDVMVGSYRVKGADARKPVMWRAGQAQFLPVPGSSAEDAGASDVSADGAVIVGQRTVPGDDRNWKSWNVVRWCNGRATEMALPPGMLGYGGSALSDDGSAVIVRISPSATDEGFLARWTLSHGIQSIAPITFASHISTNGCVVVAWSYDPVQDTELPYLWTPSIGARPLQQYLASRGVDLQGCTLRDSSCSPDGSVIFGMLTRPDGSVRGYRLAGLAIPDAAIPRAPANIRATDGTSTSNVTVTWTASPGATGYKVFRSIHPAVPTLLATLGNVSSWVDTSATPGAIYEYVVRATNASGESGIGGADDGWRGMGGTVPTIQVLPFMPKGCNSDGSVLFGHDLGWEDLSNLTVYRWTATTGTQALGVPAGAQYVGVRREEFEDPTAMVSGSGTHVSGHAYGASGSLGAVRWQGTVPTTVFAVQSAMGISADGTAIYGNNYLPQDNLSFTRAVLWRNGQLTTLAVPPGFPSTWAADASASCDVVVGECEGPEVGGRAVRWRSGLHELLALPAGFADCHAELVSADGSVAVGGGWSPAAPNEERALRWSNGRVVVVPGVQGMPYSDWTSLSGDGSTGVFHTSDGWGEASELALWTVDGGRTSLAPMQEWDAFVSDNGRVVIGHARSADGWPEPYVWTPLIGVRKLADYLVARGVSIPANRTLGKSWCSPDGKVLFGDLRGPNGFVGGYRLAGLVLPGTGTPPAPGFIQASDGTSAAGVTVTWQASPGATGYAVLRALGTAAPIQLASVGTVTTYLDATAAPGTTYEYTVRAVNAAGTSGIGGADNGSRAGSPCIGDLNADRSVNGDDLGLLLGAWGTAPSGTSADLNGDGAVNGDDLGALLGGWGACPP